MVAEVDKRKPSGCNGGGKSSGRAGEQPRPGSKPRPTAAARSHSGETVPQGTNPHRVVDLEMEDTSPQRSRIALFSEQLREIDQAIKEFDILKEENKGKDNHVVYNRRVPASHGVRHTSDYQLSHNNSLGKENKTRVSMVDKTNGDRCTEKLGSWKRIPREPVEGKDRASGEKAVGDKRKYAVPLK
nr:hypothetical protein CFP56_15838 [Quercus suber]